MYRKTDKFIIVKIILIALIVITFIYSANIKPKEFIVKCESNLSNIYLQAEYIEVKVDKEEEVEKEKVAVDNDIKPVENVNENEKNVNKNTDDKKTETKKVETNKNESIKEEKKEEKVEKKEEPVVKQNTNDEVKKEDTSATIETLTGSLAAYGPDCYGCTSFKTASGRYIGDGKIYYEDKTYGTVRIVAGDKKYPFGTIVKITNIKNSDDIYAIVLDRGSGIGIDKKFLFDLLFESEKQASNFGSKSNVKFEIKRLGY